MGKITYHQRRLVLGWATLLMAILILLDLYEDYIEGAHWEHLIVEIALFSISSFIFLYVLAGLFDEKRKRKSLESTLHKLSLEQDQMHQEMQGYLSGLAAVIECQFGQWKLTPSEHEVGFLLLKGLSLKEISSVRQTSEKTVQAQTQAIYKKANLHSRSEFAAFFLEDLLPQRRLDA